jgi:isoamylase
MSRTLSFERGTPDPVGATPTGDGVNFAVFSDHADRIELCLFSDDGRRELCRLPFPERTGSIWHGFVPGLLPGQKYGFRAYGPYDPEAGHRFNPQKLLMDPYARRVTGHPRWSNALLGGDPRSRTRPSGRDSAPFMPRSVVDPLLPEGPVWQGTRHPPEACVLYETHVKGMTQRMPGVPHPGTFLGMASDPVLEHLIRLGVTTVELLPVHAFLNDRALVRRGLTNYWGYQPLGYFAPDPRYLVAGEPWEFRQMVSRFHAAGLEVVLDVVYNHTGEGNETGPTYAFRGLDNASYYRLAEDRSRYVDTSGCGNALNLDHPMVLRMVLDSLRYWVQKMGVDGFRFDLAPALARTESGFSERAAFLQAVRQDPVLAGVRLIAEPWDLGPGGYRLGAFPPPFLEWNDQYRDTVRKFWRGDSGMARALAGRLLGSADRFDHAGRSALSSVNFVTAHDGFTLQDLVSYSEKHNHPNGEENRDGHDQNHADHMGVEGETEDPAVLARRDRRRRNLMATLLLSQGTPMLLAGDEVGHSQKGNNNPYCQDNETTWIDWERGDVRFLDFVREWIAFRRAQPILRQRFFLHSRARWRDGKEDLVWWHPSGRRMTGEDWEDPHLFQLCVELRMSSATPRYVPPESALFLVLNSGGALRVVLPEPPRGARWVRRQDTAGPLGEEADVEGPEVEIAADSVVVLVLEEGSR